MTHPTTQQRGEALNQLSRLVFDRAAHVWWGSLILEAFSGVLAISAQALTEVTPTPADAKVIVGFIIFAVLLTAYTLRLWSEGIYDNSETMRRQSVLAEGLAWAIEATQFSEWRRKAGTRTLSVFKMRPRDPDYYTTKAPAGATRLLHMTVESAFFTRHLYYILRIELGSVLRYSA